MPLFILRYWSQFLAAVVGGLLVWQVHLYLNGRAESNHQAAMAEQKSAMLAACAEANKINEELTYAHNQKVSDLQRRVNELKRLQPAYVRTRDISSRASGSNGTRTDGLFGGNEISTEPLYDLAGKAQLSSIKVTDLQTYIKVIEPYIAKCENR